MLLIPLLALTLPAQATGPKLTIQRSTNDTCLLSWAVTTNEYVVLSATNLLAGPWTPRLESVTETAGGVSANYIAKWDGSSWSPLGSGMSGGDAYTAVYALTLSGSTLYGTTYVTPRLFSPSWSDGEFRVSMEGTPCETCSLRSSSNWMDWTTVTNVTLSTGPVTVTVPAPADQSFYQMVTPSVS